MSAPSAYGNTTAALCGNALTREGKAGSSAGTAASGASTMFLPDKVRSATATAQWWHRVSFSLKTITDKPNVENRLYTLCRRGNRYSEKGAI